jgi:protein-S-isoprenylcysteine O-methyltransferase Ste14
VAVLLLFSTQVISVFGMLGPMVTPLLLWVLAFPRTYASRELLNVFLCGGSILGLVIFYSGIVIFCVSLLQWFWYRHKKHRFFTKGLYSRVRHPQFLGIILVSLGLTIALLSNTNGWMYNGVYQYLPHNIGMNELIGLWFLQVLGYIGFALLEEWSLSKRFSEFKEYKEKVPLLLPVKHPKIIPEAIFTIMLVLAVCAILFLLPYDLFFW